MTSGVTSLNESSEAHRFAQDVPGARRPRKKGAVTEHFGWVLTFMCFFAVWAIGVAQSLHHIKTILQQIGPDTPNKATLGYIANRLANIELMFQKIVGDQLSQEKSDDIPGYWPDKGSLYRIEKCLHSIDGMLQEGELEDNAKLLKNIETLLQDGGPKSIEKPPPRIVVTGR